jgi:hypothetical protein
MTARTPPGRRAVASTGSASCNGMWCGALIEKIASGTEAVRQVDGGYLPERDGGRLLSGLWQMIQTNGPHPGQTDSEETRWRMQMVTATARFLVGHFQAET